MKPGDIVLVRYPFTDFSSEKLRPALVLIPEDDEGDTLLAFITSVLIKKNSFDLPIPKGTTGLRVDSILRLKKMMSVHRSLMLGRIGSVDSALWKRIQENLRRMLGL